MTVTVMGLNSGGGMFFPLLVQKIEGAARPYGEVDVILLDGSGPTKDLQKTAVVVNLIVDQVDHDSEKKLWLQNLATDVATSIKALTEIYVYVQKELPIRVNVFERAMALSLP
jgi:hypothetical protein